MEIGIPVLFSERAIQDLEEINDYIAERGYPETALTYTNRIFDFCQTLSDFPLKHKICQRKGYKRFNYRCAVFEKTYIVAYRVEKNQTLMIKRVIYGRRLA